MIANGGREERKVNLRDSSNSCFRSKSERVYHVVLSVRPCANQQGQMFDRRDGRINYALPIFQY